MVSPTPFAFPHGMTGSSYGMPLDLKYPNEYLKYAYKNVGIAIKTRTEALINSILRRSLL